MMPWKSYEPVAFSVGDYQVDIPNRGQLTSAFRTELDHFIKRELQVMEQPLKERLSNRPGDSRTLNKLGVLYARYGHLDEARKCFRDANKTGYYVPALVNLGNVAFLEGDYTEARASWKSALKEEPDNNKALLGMARIEFASEHYSAAEEAHSRLAISVPRLWLSASAISETAVQQ